MNRPWCFCMQPMNPWALLQIERVLLGDLQAPVAAAELRGSASQNTVELLNTLQACASDLDGSSVDAAVALMANLSQRPNGRSEVAAVLAETIERLREADEAPASMELRQMREVLVHTLCRAGAHHTLSDIIVDALQQCPPECGEFLIPQLPRAAESVENFVDLLDPFLALLEDRLATSSLPDDRCRAVTTCCAVWERACERWPEAGATQLRKLAAELANSVVATLKYDPSSKARLAALRYHGK